jgi:hypothetical protein
MASGDSNLSEILGEAIGDALKHRETRRRATSRRSSAPKAPSLSGLPHLRELLATTGAESATATELARFIHEVIQAELKRTRA